MDFYVDGDEARRNVTETIRREAEARLAVASRGLSPEEVAATLEEERARIAATPPGVRDLLRMVGAPGQPRA